jgi:hypothetical protein
MPLWTILTKWPAPFCPQCSQPCSAGTGSPERPGVRGVGHHLVVAADHEAVAAVQAPDPAAGPAVDQVDAALPQPGRPLDVVAVVRVAAVDDDVARFHPVGELVDDLLGDLPRGHHHPGRARLGQAGDEVVQGRGPGGALAGELLHGVRVPVVDDARLAVAHEPADDVRSHPA